MSDKTVFSADDVRLLHHAAATTVQVYDAAESESGVPPHAPLYGKRDRLLELARLLDHGANHGHALVPRELTLSPWVAEALVEPKQQEYCYRYEGTCSKCGAHHSVILLSSHPYDGPEMRTRCGCKELVYFGLEGCHFPLLKAGDEV